MTEARTYDESSGKMDCRYCNTFLRPVFRCDTDCAAGTAAAGRSVRGKAGGRLCERFGTDRSHYLARQQYAFDQGCNGQGQEAAECCNRAGNPRVGQSVQSPFKAFSGLEKAVSLIELEKPTVYIIQSKDESWNYEKLLKPSQSETTPFYGKINVRKGTAVVQLPEGTWQYQIDGSVDGSYNPAFDLHFKVSAPGMETATVLGSIDNKGVGKIVMKSDGVDLAPYHPLALRYGQVKGAAGLVTDIDGEWTNDGKNTVLKGKMNLRDVRGSYQMKEQEVPFRITGPVSSADHVISTDQLQVSVNGQAAVVSGAVDIHDLDNPEGHLSLRSEKVSYEGETLTNIEAEAVMAGKQGRQDQRSGRI